MFGFGEVDHPKLCFIAEAPGEREKIQLKPLVGKSGQLLRQVLSDLQVNTDEVFFTNTCLCKGPGPNTAPVAKMVNACYGGLLEELDAVRPNLVVAMGNHAAKALGQYKRGVSSIRGLYRELELDSGFRVRILPTYHPAAILRNPDLFRDFVTDLERAVRIGIKGDPPTVAPPIENYLVIEHPEQLSTLLDHELAQATAVAVDIETDGKDLFDGHILDLGLAWMPQDSTVRAASIDWALVHNSTHWFDKVKEVLESKAIIMQESRFDMPWLWSVGIQPRLVFDTAIAHWLLDERRGMHSLAQMASRYLGAPDYKGKFRRKHGLDVWTEESDEVSEGGWAAVPSRERRIYNATDADYTLRLAQLFKPDLKKQGLLRINKLLVEATYLYSELFYEGINVDWKYLGVMEGELGKQLEVVTAKLTAMAPLDLNMRSPKQLAAYLFDELKLEPFGGVPADGQPIPQDVISAAIQDVHDPAARAFWQKSAQGSGSGSDEDEEGGGRGQRGGIKSRSTSKFMLYYLALQHDFPKALIEYREAKKRLSLWVGDIKRNRWPDGKVRPSYKLNATLNGRFTSKGPSVHTLPPGRMYDVFTAPPGFVIIHADYSQADMRVMAQFSRDERYAEWLRKDPHTELVKEIAHLNDADIQRMPKEELRSRRMGAKMVNFGLPYGRGPESLAPQMGISVDDAKRYVQAYWRELPTLRRWIDTRLQHLRDNEQEIVSPFGNKRRLPLILDRQHARAAGRLAVNMPVMATVNYLTVLAHIKVVRALRAKGIETKVYPHVHDSFNVAVPREHVDEAVRVVVEVAATVPEVIHFDLDFCPFPVEVTAGFHWGTQVSVFEKGKQTTYEEARARAGSEA